ncbi:hypothetical protein PR048_011255 [Dryococelus australis]|uniref:DDE-1 domain-containing protein n=1 Tax=Dryococelus australis TaxID=614101 RepID=A0ABQ9HL35_9NEOP|nr:hypothetical protein PR048_011255 [Dryococelus australis]
MAGEDWVSSFMKGYNFSMRTPESSSIGRTICFNPVQVGKCFNLLKDCDYYPSQIFNTEESSLSTVSTKLPKIISSKGTKMVSKVVYAERGKNVTIVCSISATGVYVPPFLTFPRKRMRAELLHDLPPGSEGHASETGWMKSELFVTYRQHFVNHTPTLGCFIFLPLKTFYRQACDNFMVSHPGQAITDRDVAQIYDTALLRAGTVANAVKCFKACGIEPYNPQIFAEEYLAPSTTTERDLQAEPSYD